MPTSRSTTRPNPAMLSQFAGAAGSASSPRLTVSEQVLAAELGLRGECSDALSMMVSSIARMVQAGRSSDSRWKAS